MEQLQFAMYIREARTGKGLTQKELAARLHVTDKAVSKWERALSLPDIELLVPLSKELDIPLAKLLGVEETVCELPERNTEALMEELILIMKDRVQQELKRRKRWLCAAILLFVSMSLFLFGAKVYGNHVHSAQYAESTHILSYEELKACSVEEKDGMLFLDMLVPDATELPYEVYRSFWWDPADPTILYYQCWYATAEHLLYDSAQEYDAYKSQTGAVPRDPHFRIYIETGEQEYKETQVDGYEALTSASELEQMKREPELPVTKVVYRGAAKDSDEADVVLWEK